MECVVLERHAEIQYRLIIHITAQEGNRTYPKRLIKLFGLLACVHAGLELTENTYANRQWMRNEV